MCINCWNDWKGNPPPWNAQCEAALAAVEALYENEPAGGALHIVTDDWNLETENIEWCMKQDRVTSEARQAALLLLDLSEEERASVLAVYDELWSPVRRLEQP